MAVLGFKIKVSHLGLLETGTRKGKEGGRERNKERRGEGRRADVER